MQRKHCFFKQAKGDRFIPARPRSSIEYELQQAKLKGIFDNMPPTLHQNGICRAAFGRSYKQINQLPLLGFSLPPSCAPVPVKRPLYTVNQGITLDAPDLINDFYRNPIRWATPNTIYIGLGSDLYCYNTKEKYSYKINAGSDHSSINALAYNSGILARSGTNTIQFIDTTTNIEIGKTYRANVINIASDHHQGFYFLSKGSSTLGHLDNRSGRITDLTAPINLPIGLAFNPCNQTIAVSTDPIIELYDERRPSTPRLEYSKHKSPSKALAFLTGSRAGIVSGGGLHDRTLQIWNSNTGQTIASVNAGAQICGVYCVAPNSFFVAEGEKSNQVSCWSFYEDNLHKEASMEAHKARVLFSAQNPENKEEIITGSPDETLRFWSVENTKNPKKRIISEAPDTLFNSATIR